MLNSKILLLHLLNNLHHRRSLVRSLRHRVSILLQLTATFRSSLDLCPCIPNHHMGVPSTTHELSPIGGEVNCIARDLMAMQSVHDSSSSKIPNSHCCVGAAGGESQAIGVEANLVDQVGVCVVGLYHFIGSYVKYFNFFIAATTCDTCSIGIPLDIRDHPRVVCICIHTLPFSVIP